MARSTATKIALIAALAIASCGGDDNERDDNAATDPGQQIFTDQGCGSCHTLAAADATGDLGPNLDEHIPGEPKRHLRESITEPNATIAEGFSAGIMPTSFDDKLTNKQLEQLVDFLTNNAGR